ncbi:MAG: efflux transporter outer membrane subunit [Kofleriaceae bacterium]|nr:efflux transporter outer membrane subunit [Kofleriaceae bacterium]
MHKLAAVISALALSACSFIPKYERPAAPVANQFPSSGPPGALAAADQGWRSMFGDARLQGLIKLALANNRDLRVAALQVEEVRAQYQIVRSDLFPQVGATGSATFQRETATQPGQLYRIGGSASWELDLFGRVRSSSKAALEQYLAAKETHRAAHLALVGEVVSQYLRLCAYEEELAIAQQTLEAVKGAYDLTSRQLEAGTRSELDVRTSEGQVAAAKAEVARLTRLHLQSENALAVLIGQPMPQNLPAGQPLESQQMIAELGAGVPSEVLLRRPDVAAAEHALIAANANIGAARAAFFPTISLTGFAGLASTALGSLITGGAAAWSFIPSITVPLFTGGRNSATLDVAKVRKNIQVARYEQTIQNAFREVADALVARGYLDEQLQAQTERVTALQKRYEISEQRYRGGIESYIVVLVAQQDLYQAQTQLVEVRVARLQNLADLYRSLGGGWKES